jgi:hypothetical protein
MANLYRKTIGNTTLRCYSERGLMSYFMFHVLPDRMQDFLRNIEFSRNSPNRLHGIPKFEELTLFSELGFGNEGFGNPDGAIWFRHEGRPVLIMIEVKLNQTWQQSCRATASYNSTIRGQLELKWRLMTLYKSGRFTDILGVRYIVENDGLIEGFREYDSKYANVNDMLKLGFEGRRRLRLVQGVGEFFKEYVAPTNFEDIYYLALTNERKNPLDHLPDLRPRCIGENGQEVADGLNQFCWASKDVIEI